MTLDILAALEATPSTGSRRCKLATFLDSIPEDAPGRDGLLARVRDPRGFPAQSLALTFAALKHPISDKMIRDHRAERCLCFR